MFSHIIIIYTCGDYLISGMTPGSLAENLMEVLCQNKEVSNRIKQIRRQTKAEKKRLAMAVREKQLLSIGARASGPLYRPEAFISTCVCLWL